LTADAVVSYNRSKHLAEANIFVFVGSHYCRLCFTMAIVYWVKNGKYSHGSHVREHFPQGNITCFVEGEPAISNERHPPSNQKAKYTLLRGTRLQKHRESSV